jgi:uncharacterized protein YcbX
LAALLGPNVRVIKMDVGVFDSMPLSLISTRTLGELSESTGRTLEPERFRPNLMVETSGAGVFPEEGWCGQVLRIGSLRMRIDQRDRRCVIVTVDPLTTQRDPQILRHIAAARDGCAGVYGTTATPGVIRIGDRVVLEPADGPDQPAA